MLLLDSPTAPPAMIEDDLESLIQRRTGRQVSGLHVERHPGHVVLHGRARSFYVKQVAQHCVLESFPRTQLVNAIVVDAQRSAGV